MRRATTLTLAVLMAMILGAAAVQLFFVADRSEAVDLRVADARGAEGNLRFVVQLSSASDGDVAVRYATVDANAVAGLDYTAASGEAVVTSGETATVIEVEVLPRAGRTAEVRFVLELSDPRGADIDDGRAIGTIEP